MVNIFEYDDYRKYINASLEAIKPNAYGMKGKLAHAIGVSSSFVSQVLNGAKTFTPDQTHRLGEFLGLNDIEYDFLHLLTEYDRAGSLEFKKRLATKLKIQQRAALKLGKRVPRTRELNDEQRATYYSSWLYAAARNLSALPDIKTSQQIAERLKIEPSALSSVIRFLLDQGLCNQTGGKITYGTAAIHVDSDSTYVNQHHKNWRIQGLQTMDSRNENNMFFTCPMSLSEEAYSQIREKIPAMIQEIMKISAPSPSETVCCINIDLFKY